MGMTETPTGTMGPMDVEDRLAGRFEASRPRLRAMAYRMLGSLGDAEDAVQEGWMHASAAGTEGVANLVRTALKESLKATITRQVGALLSRSAFTDFKKRLDHTEYGGAPLLGVKGVCIITHGSSNANAIKNAIRVAAEFSERNINADIERELAAIPRAMVST